MLTFGLAQAMGPSTNNIMNTQKRTWEGNFAMTSGAGGFLGLFKGETSEQHQPMQ